MKKSAAKIELAKLVLKLLETDKVEPSEVIELLEDEASTLKQLTEG